MCLSCDRVDDSRDEMAGAQLVRDSCVERVYKERESPSQHFPLYATRRVSLARAGMSFHKSFLFADALAQDESPVPHASVRRKTVALSR